MSDSTYANQFSWDDHTKDDTQMGRVLVLEMNENQINMYLDYNFQQYKTNSFLTTVSLPFMNNKKWFVYSRWNGTEQIHKSDAIVIAKQFERQYMPFVHASLKRSYLLAFEYDPVMFISDSLSPVPQIKKETFVRWKDLFGKVVNKLYNEENLYIWSLGTEKIYQIQLLNVEASVKNRQVIFKDEFFDITADPNIISIDNESDFLWELSSYLLSIKENWTINTSELDSQIVKVINNHLKHKRVNKKVKEKQCFVPMKTVEYEKYMLVKSTKKGLTWSDNKISVSLIELKQLFGSTAGERVFIIKGKTLEELKELLGANDAEKIYKLQKKNKRAIKWTYFANQFDLRRSSVASKLFISFTPRAKDPNGDVIAT